MIANSFLPLKYYLQAGRFHTVRKCNTTKATDKMPLFFRSDLWFKRHNASKLRRKCTPAMRSR